MSKFIKVTCPITGDVSHYNSSGITCFRDGEIWTGEFSMDVLETAEQIEAQLLRDEFAKHALSGFCADREMSTEGTIRLSYEYADAMLKERSK